MTDTPADAELTVGTQEAAPSVQEQTLVSEFAAEKADYYSDTFVHLQQNRLSATHVNRSALLAGPFWGARRGNWTHFWIALLLDVSGLMLMARGLFADPEKSGEFNLLWGIAVFICGRLLTARFADQLYYRQYQSWRIDRAVNAGVSASRIQVGLALILALGPMLVYRATQIAPTLRECKRMWRAMGKGDEVSVGDRFNCWVIGEVPIGKNIQQPVAGGINDFIDWMTITFVTFFDAITIGIRGVLNLLELIFVGTPWPVMAFMLVLVAWRTAGKNVAIFTGLALFYLGMFGFWQKSMSTLSLVGAATLICVLLGVPIGIWCAKSPRIYAFIRPVLDIMQTLPSFVYLIPAIAFFGVGKPPGILATVIFALPPMVRLTVLGITQVPESVKEAALAFGATPRQLLWKVELPLAVTSIMTGINQTIMMSLSMVVVAALIAAKGLGEDVLFALQHVEHGLGLLAGAAIALCAMIMDRIVQGARKPDNS